MKKITIIVSIVVIILIVFALILFLPKKESLESKLGDGICDIENERGTNDCYTFPYGEFEKWRTNCEDIGNGTSQKTSCNTSQIKESFDSGKEIYYCCSKN